MSSASAWLSRESADRRTATLPSLIAPSRALGGWTTRRLVLSAWVLPSARSMSGSAAPARPCFRFAQQVAADCDHLRRRVRRRVHLQRADPYELLRRYDDGGRALFFTAGMLARSGSAYRGADQPPHRPRLHHACGRVPASLLLFLAALAPNLGIATAYLTLCGSLSQLDVPTLAAIDLSQSGRKSGPDAMKFILMPFSLAATVAPVLAGWQLLSFSTTTANIVLLCGRYA